MMLVPFQFVTAIFVQLNHGMICKVSGALNSRVNIIVVYCLGLQGIAMVYAILNMPALVSNAKNCPLLLLSSILWVKETTSSFFTRVISCNAV